MGRPGEGSTDSSVGGVGGFVVRRYGVGGDYGVFSGWVGARGVEAVGAGVLPELGVVVCGGVGLEPVGMVFAYVVGGVGIVAWLTTRPGLAAGVGREVCEVALGAIEGVCRGRGVGCLLGIAGRGGLVRLLVRGGWEVVHAQNVFLMKEFTQAAGADGADFSSLRGAVAGVSGGGVL